MKLDTLPKITARTISNLLREKHSQDVFVEECKDGPTQSRIEHFKMDAWVMNKSWANPCVTAYEIKCSRNDFLRDTKWRAYLPLCNELYFICPRDLIAESEVSDGVGLMYVASTGNRIFAKRKAAYRDVTIPEEVFRYILMCRATIGTPTTDNARNWRAWLEKKAEDRELGWDVSKAIREHCHELECQNERLKTQCQSYDQIAKFCDSLGLTDFHHTPWSVQRKVESLMQAVPPGLLESLRQVIQSATQAEFNLKKLNEQEAAA